MSSAPRAFFFSVAAAAALLLTTSSALAEKVAVLPFRAQNNVPRPELEQARGWTQEALKKKGHTLPNDAEAKAAEASVKDGTADTSEELRAAGKAAQSPWAMSAFVQRIDYPPAKNPDGSEEEAWSTYRIELEACEVESGRVESVAREVLPETAPDEIAEMIGFLVRPGGIGPNAVFPWTGQGPRKPKPKPKPAPPPPPPQPPPPPPPPVKKYAYGENAPFAIGVSGGVSNALSRPGNARGPSWAVPIGVAFGYAFAEVPGLEARGIFTSQIIGPKAIEIAAGGRYAIPVLPQYRIFMGPEALIGAHVAIGAEKTARFIAHGSAFAAIGVSDSLQFEIAGDIAGAFGGSGTLVLGGGTARALLRF